jgi:hypothetical protein
LGLLGIFFLPNSRVYCALVTTPNPLLCEYLKEASQLVPYFSCVFTVFSLRHFWLLKVANPSFEIAVFVIASTGATTRVG